MVARTACFALLLALASVAAPWQPDLRLLTAHGGAPYGDNRYDESRQAVSRLVAPGTTSTFWFDVQNDGGAEDTFTVSATPATFGWDVRLFTAAGEDVTALATGVGWRVTLLPAATASFLVRQTPSLAGYTPLPVETRIVASSATDPLVTDTFVMTISARPPSAPPAPSPAARDSRPDLMLLRPDGTAWLGDSIYGSAESQRRLRYVCRGVPATYILRLENDAAADDTFTVSCPPAPTGWTALYTDDAGTDITALVTGAGWQVPLPPGAARLFALTTVPGDAVASYACYRAAVTASAATASDTVEAVTLCMPPALMPTTVFPYGLPMPAIGLP